MLTELEVLQLRFDQLEDRLEQAHSYPMLMGALQGHASAVIRSAPRAPAVHDYEIAVRMEEFLATRWPRRRYFVEVTSDPEQRGWIQLFQPHGVPHDMRAELATLTDIVKGLVKDAGGGGSEHSLSLSALAARLGDA